MLMKSLEIFRKSLSMALLLVAVASGSTRAQWTNVAPNLCPQEQQYHGAIRFRDGVVWAGTTALFYSNDTGKSWSSVPTFQAGIKGPQGISDIAIYDSLHILVSIIDDTELFITSDGGRTWKDIQPSGLPLYGAGGIVQVAYNGSPSTIHVLEEYPNLWLLTSMDGGTTWSQSTPNPSAIALCFAIAADKSIYVLLENGKQGWINRSTDLGNTWSANSSTTDVDCNTISVDSCDANRLYLVNENTIEKSDNNSRIDMTTDAGATWQASITEPLDYFNGSLSSTRQVLYAGGAPKEGTITTSGVGVTRSTDDGMTWKNIGGPLECFDTRTIAAVDNNIVLVLDTGGSVWRTMNSGGDSLTFPENSATPVLAISPENLSQATCNQAIDTSISIGIIACGLASGTLDSLWITGSNAFQVTDTRSAPRTLEIIDSIQVSYAGTGAQDTAELHLVYDLGSGTMDTAIQLIGNVASPLLTEPVQIHRESASSYFGQPDSLTLAVDISSQINLDSIWPCIGSIHGTYTWDSSVARYASYIPPPGWQINSVNSRGDAVDFSIQKVSATPSNPLDLGTAIFQPANDMLATTWVELPALTIDICGQTLSPCITDNEDNHWAVKTLGTQSGVTEVPAPLQTISLYPNPADGNVWIYSNNDLGNVTIVTYDMLGEEQSEIETSIQVNTPIELTLPAVDGIYNILLKSPHGTYSLRVVQNH